MGECGLGIFTAWLFLGLGVLFGMLIVAMLVMTKSDPDASHD